jgi:hypothetical protein
MEGKLKIGILLPLCAILLSTFLSINASGAISISLVGVWSETVDASDLAGGAGSDLISTYESASNQVSIDLTGTTGDSDAWRVDIKRADTAWHGDLHLSLRRTSDGSGSGSISGGASYQEITDTYSEFFSGSGDRTGINVQLKINGVSVGVPADSYSTTVYYTVVDTN